jgi:hypothetical protein
MSRSDETRVKGLVRNVIKEFEEFYLGETIKNRAQGDGARRVDFREFISNSKYESIKETLEENLGGNYDNLEQLIYDNLTEEQKKRVGGIFRRDVAEFFEGSFFSKEADVIERRVVNVREYDGYMDTKDFLNEDQRDRLASRVAGKLYEKLDESEKKLVNERTIKKYLLNIGFIRSKRSSHKNALAFIIEYPALFRDEDDVVSHILGRYIDEELTKTSIEETSRKISSLRNEVRNLYRGIKNES